MTGIRFGTWAVLKLAITIIIFAIFKSIYKDKKSMLISMAFLGLSQIISLLFFVLIGKENGIDIGSHLLEIALAVAFMPAFAFALNAIYKADEIGELSAIELGAILILIIAMFSGFNKTSLSGVTIYSLISVIALMIACWKKSIKDTIIFSALAGMISLLIVNGKLELILLYIIAGLVGSLLSRAGKKGIIIGIIFAAVYLLAFAPTEEDIYSKLGMNANLVKDYNKFLETQKENASKGSGENSFSEFANAIEFEQMPNLAEEVKKSTYTPASTMTKQMLIAFVILVVLPIAFYKRYEYLTRNMRSRGEDAAKAFANRNVLLLDAGKEVEEDPSKKKKNTSKIKKTTSKPKGASKKKKK